MRSHRTPTTALLALLAIAALQASGCTTLSPAAETDPDKPRRLLAEGLSLYDAGEFTRAAARFAEASSGLRDAGERELAREATAAECTAWLRARKLKQLDECSDYLETLVHRADHSDPGMNTLIALGAVAGDRELPPYRLPSRVQPLVRAAAAEAR